MVSYYQLVQKLIKVGHFRRRLKIGNHDIVNKGPRAGFNLSWSKSDSDESPKAGLSIFWEHCMFNVKIANFKEEKNGIVFTNDFESKVKKIAR